MLAKDKMWNGSGWYRFIEVISTSMTDISLTCLVNLISKDTHLVFFI